MSPIGGLISGDNLQRYFCVFFEAEDLESNSPNDYVVKLIFVWSCNTIFNKVLEDGEGSGDFILMRIKLSKWALHVSFLSPSPPSLLALPVHEPSYGHHLHSTCKGSRKVQLFFLLALTTLIFHQIPGSK